VFPGTIAARVSETAAGLSRLMAGGLGADLARRMRRSFPVEAPNHPHANPGYGLGLITDGYPPAVVGHGGAGPGFTLYVAASADGSRAHGEAVAAEVDDTPLVQACLAALRKTPNAAALAAD
jgi:D-alanyl-D-alanine carboxypeptidase